MSFLYSTIYDCIQSVDTYTIPQQRFSFNRHYTQKNSKKLEGLSNPFDLTILLSHRSAVTGHTDTIISVTAVVSIIAAAAPAAIRCRRSCADWHNTIAVAGRESLAESLIVALAVTSGVTLTVCLTNSAVHAVAAAAATVATTIVSTATAAVASVTSAASAAALTTTIVIPIPLISITSTHI